MKTSFKILCSVLIMSGFFLGGYAISRADTLVEIKSQGRIESEDVVYDANDFNVLLSAMEDGKVESYNRGKTKGYAEGYEAGGISTSSLTIDGVWLCNKTCYANAGNRDFATYFTRSDGTQATETGYRYIFTQQVIDTYRYFLFQCSAGHRSVPAGSQNLFGDIFYLDAKKLSPNAQISTSQKFYSTVYVYGIR